MMMSMATTRPCQHSRKRGVFHAGLLLLLNGNRLDLALQGLPTLGGEVDVAQGLTCKRQDEEVGSGGG